MVTPHSDGPVPAPGRRPVGRLALAGAAVLVSAVALGAGLFWAYSGRPRPQPEPAPAPDPRLEYAGPFRNVAPSVRYVAEARCADCHADIARSFADHPMGRSILPVARAAAPPEDARHGNPFDALGSHFQVARDGDRVLHRRSRPGAAGQPVAELDFPVQYVIGSGTHGHSYLTDRGGYLFETPVSWYAQKKTWGLSPGFGPALLTGRPVQAECLFCHANRADGVADLLNRYAEPVFDGPAIGCQRCHGPGELHVAAREAGEPVAGGADTTIVNPARLEPALREAVCEQCHLEGVVRVVRRGRGLYDFRPGLPLERFWSAFVGAASAGETRSAVGHVEQMAESGCYRGGSGSGRLGCVSCHDPHRDVPPAERVAWYRGRCLKCHEQHGCSLPRAERLRRSAEDSCIDCHMPPYGTSDIPHTASTDHRIPRRAGAPGREGRPTHPEDGIPVVSFYRDRQGAGGAEDERDLGVALVKLALTGTARDGRALGRAADLLGTACRRDPGDLEAAEARGHALALQGHWAEALRAFEAVLARAPEREMALVGAGTAAEALAKPEEALGYWRRAVAVDPWAPDYRRRVALLLVEREDWDEAQAECDAWVRLDPFSAEAGAARVRCLLAAGRKEEARAEFARVGALAPENLPELEARFRNKLK